MLLAADCRLKRALFARFLALFCGRPVCNLRTYGETIHSALRRRPGDPLAGGRTWQRSSIFAAPEAKAPPHDRAWGGAVAPTSHFPKPVKTTKGVVRHTVRTCTTRCVAIGTPTQRHTMNGRSMEPGPRVNAQLGQGRSLVCCRHQG